MIARLRRFLRRFLRDDRGVTAIEAALLFPVVLVMIAGIAEYSRLLLAHHMLRDIIEEQARTAVVTDLGAGAVEANVDAAVAAVPGVGTTTVDVDVGETLLTITVSGSFRMFFGELLPDSLVDFSLAARYPR